MNTTTAFLFTHTFTSTNAVIAKYTGVVGEIENENEVQSDTRENISLEQSDEVYTADNFIPKKQKTQINSNITKKNQEANQNNLFMQKALSALTEEEDQFDIFVSESPASASKQKNLTGLPRVARDIVADLFNNIQQWNDSHIVGANLTKNILQLKADNINDLSKELENLTTDLYNIVQRLSGITGAFEFLTNQIKSLVKLHKKSTPFFVSLENKQLVELIEQVCEAYKAEFKVKKFVLENIAHSHNNSEIMFYTVCWTHQQNINSGINMKVETLLTETGHRKFY
ncbi:hypothetical protein FQA39_LY18548 [Lamprigera yunnana]|nr:hypothetical protein FQA39_LY18548 [Lamprigera yunnana]